MLEPQSVQVLKKANLNFFIQYVVEVDATGNKRPELRIKIKDDKGKEINHNFVYPEDYGTYDALKNIRKLLEYYKFTQSNKLEEGLREEILIWTALLLARVA